MKFNTIEDIENLFKIKIKFKLTFSLSIFKYNEKTQKSLLSKKFI